MHYAKNFLKPRGNRSDSIEITEEMVQKDRAITEYTLNELKREGVNVDRPTQRSECPTYRPCPFVGCRYHNYLDIMPRGKIKFNFVDVKPENFSNSCSLDVAEGKPLSLKAIGDIIGLTRERVRQIQESAVSVIKRKDEF